MLSKEMYIKEAGNDDLKITEYSPLDKVIAEAKRKFRAGKSDEAWGLYNQALMLTATSPNIYVGSHFLSKQWCVIRPMAIQLIAEGKYKNALGTLLRLVGLEVYQFTQDPNNPIGAIASGNLGMIEDVIGWGAIDKPEFEKIFDDVMKGIMDVTIKSAKVIDANSGMDLITIKDVDTIMLKSQLIDQCYNLRS